MISQLMGMPLPADNTKKHRGRDHLGRARGAFIR